MSVATIIILMLLAVAAAAMVSRAKSRFFDVEARLEGLEQRLREGKNPWLP